jgi:hypothetical protein
MYQTTSPASLSLATICSLSVYLQKHHNDNREAHAALLYARDARVIFPLNNKKRTPHEVHCKKQTNDELTVIIAAAKLCCMLRSKDQNAKRVRTVIQRRYLLQEGAHFGLAFVSISATNASCATGQT